MKSTALGLPAALATRNAREGCSRSRIVSPLGTIVVVSNRAGELEALDFADHEPRLRRLLARYHRVDLDALAEAQPPEGVRAALGEYFAGRLSAIDSLAVGASGSAFQRAVWSALRGIRAGTTTTYGRLAEALGRPTAARAVGMANGANPVAVVVPCHRVVGADGSLTGYGGGIERKRWLLDHERRWAASAEPG